MVVGDEHEVCEECGCETAISIICETCCETGKDGDGMEDQASDNDQLDCPDCDGRGFEILCPFCDRVT